MKRYANKPLETNIGLLCAHTDDEAGDWVKYEDAQAAIQEAVLAEREACAKIAEETWEADEGGGEDESGYPRYGENSARSIRARSQK